jgi:hypothetical protein
MYKASKNVMREVKAAEKNERSGDQQMMDFSPKGDDHDFILDGDG